MMFTRFGLDLPGRKKAKFTRPFYTMLGRDAEDALRLWLNHRKQYRDVGDEIFVSQDGHPLIYSSVISYHTVTCVA